MIGCAGPRLPGHCVAVCPWAWCGGCWSAYLGVSKIRGPSYRPQIVALLLSKDTHKKDPKLWKLPLVVFDRRTHMWGSVDNAGPLKNFGHHPIHDCTASGQDQPQHMHVCVCAHVYACIITYAHTYRQTLYLHIASNITSTVLQQQQQQQ